MSWCQSVLGPNCPDTSAPVPKCLLDTSALVPKCLGTEVSGYHPVPHVCLSVCDIGVLWPNGWMDQDDSWHGGRPQPHCVRWGPSSPKEHSPPLFLVHVCSGQTAGWIKMPLGTEVGLGPADIVLNGDPAPLPKKGAEPSIFGPFLLWPNGLMHQDASAQTT